MMKLIVKEEFPKVIETFIKHYVGESGARGCVIGLSGGLDSTVVAKLSVDSVSAENVLGILMPDTSTPPENMADIRSYANELGIGTRTIDITKMVDDFNANFHDPDPKLVGNVKARIRMTILYHFANQENLIVMGTSNKSEMLTGYFTKYGDGGSDISPIGDLYKTQVRGLAGLIGVPDIFIERVPSGDLWQGQADETELKITYDLLDQILRGIELGMDNYEIKDRTHAEPADVVHVRNLVHNSIHKRRLGLIPKLGLRTVGLDWREW